MRAADLRHQITLQQPGGAQDSVGERITTWSDFATDYAHVEPLSGREQFLAAQQQASTSHMVTMRYQPRYAVIDASWRVKFGARLMVIDAIRNTDERNIELVLMCTESRRVE